MDDIDCPEIDQPYGIQAKEYLEQMILKKEVTLWGDEIDFFGRRLATVYVNGIDVNELMIAEGYCWWYKKYSDNDDYEDWEQIARDKRRGLWGQDDPIPPWEFRRQNK
ncbi:MAG: thermonuclease family protein [Thermodesulfobacteriota bacterium]